MTTFTPTVSVVIPTYNRANIIGRAIKSVLKQDLQDFEIIVVDDASRDDTESVVNAFQDSRISYIKHKTNRNGAAARNTGIRAAKGEYVALLDSDDEWLPNHLSNKISVLNKSSYQGIFGSYFIYYSSDLIYEKKCQPKLKKMSIPEYIFSGIGDTRTSTFVFRKEAILKVMFDELLAKHQDWDLAVRFDQCFGLYSDPNITVIAHYDLKERMSKKMNHQATQVFLDKYSCLINDNTLAKLYVFLAKETFDLEGKNKYYYKYINQAKKLKFNRLSLKFALLLLSYPGIDILFLGIHNLYKKIRLSFFTSKNRQQF